jgi:hypothetical protein
MLPAPVLLKSIPSSCITRFVDKVLEGQDGDVLREGIRALSESINGNVNAARRADRSQSIDDTIVQ